MLLRKPEKRLSRRSAFTLMEMMVVVAIIVVLGGIAIVAMGTFSDRGNEAKAAAAVKQLDTVVRTYALDHKGYYPATLETLQAQDEFGKVYLTPEALEAPWQGVKYEYRNPGQNNVDGTPDIWITHPSGKFQFANWKAGKIAMGH
jgi:general secretion pathway protein G